MPDAPCGEANAKSTEVECRESPGVGQVGEQPQIAAQPSQADNHPSAAKGEQTEHSDGTQPDDRPTVRVEKGDLSDGAEEHQAQGAQHDAVEDPAQGTHRIRMSDAKGTDTG